MDQLARGSFKQGGESPQIGQARPSIGPGCLDQQVPRFVFAQDIIDQIGRKGHLPTRFSLAGVLALDQSGDHRHFAERAPKQIGVLHPVVEFVGKDRWRQQDARIGRRPQAPDGQGIVVGDKAQRGQPGMLHAAGDQHAERLVRVPPLERVEYAIGTPGMGKAFDQQRVRAGHAAAPILHFQPFAHIVGHACPAGPIGQQAAYPIGEMRG